MKVLITNGRGPAALDLAKNLFLSNHTVYCADSFRFHLTKNSKYITKNFLVSSPRFKTKNYFNELKQIIIKYKIDLVIPLYDETYYLSHFKDKLSKYTDVFVDNIEKLELIRNKFNFFETAKSINLSVPETYQVTSKDQVTKYGHFLWSNVVRPCLPQINEEIFYNISLASELVGTNITKSNPWIIQESILGMHYSSYLVCKEGKVLASSIYPKEVNMDNLTVNIKSIKHPKILKWIKRFVGHTNFTGQLSIEFIEDKNKEIYAYDCSPRIGSGIHLLSNNTNLSKVFLKNENLNILPIPLTKNKVLGVVIYLSTFFNRKLFFKSLLNIFCLRDILNKKDFSTFLNQFYSFLYLKYLSIKYKVSISKANMFDIEYNGKI